MDSKIASEATPGAVETVLLPPNRALKCLSIRHIRAIDDALVALGDYGEVRVIKNGGKLRFIQTLRSQTFKGSE